MKRIKLTVAYDGTNYCGWQIQDNGITIEEVLNRELSKLLQEDIKIIGASRTDSGVHALGNIAVFDTTSRMPAEKISYALNQRLPQDIRIQKSEEVAEDFHPRKVETRKTYEYCIYHAKFANPILEKYSYFVYVLLDLKKMKQAAEILVGESSALYQRLYEQNIIDSDFSADYEYMHGMCLLEASGDSDEPERVLDELLRDIHDL